MSNLPAVREQRAFSLTDMRDMAGALAESKLFGIQTPQHWQAQVVLPQAPSPLPCA